MAFVKVGNIIINSFVNLSLGCSAKPKEDQNPDWKLIKWLNSISIGIIVTLKMTITP